MTRVICGLAASVALLWGLSAAEAAERFLLIGGGRVTGELLNPDQVPRETYVVGTAGGGQLTLERSQVERVETLRPVEEEYAKIGPSFADTVEGQWAAAEWCRENRLSPQRMTHLQRIIELDPNHADARGVLGYRLLNGKWVTQEDVMAAQGYRRYQGRWRTQQEIDLIEANRNNELAEKEWAVKIRRWRDWIGTDRDADGRRNILGIKDPHAVVALTRLLESDTLVPMRLLYIETLARIGSGNAMQALAVRSMEDPIEEVRLTCLDYLEKADSPDVIDYYVGKLRAKDNRVVNLAAVALRRLKDPSSIGPLIDALVTTHKFKIVTSKPGSMTGTFGTGPGGSGAPGGSGLSMGGGPKIITQHMSNRPVLDALIELTGQNFNFDQQAWKYWHSSQRSRGTIDARRG
ncbi:MAG TPA: HEAT repeat domain-containing protein [Thermoguttaceae bacterium]|nr:HEAT repeat domain-containing protein [Thermoguttaceae bacterium]